MRVAAISVLAALLAAGCHKQANPASAQTQPAPQEVQWNRSMASSSSPSPQVVQVALPSAQLTTNGPNVTAQLTNVKRGTELTLAWFGPDHWNVTNQSQVANGNTLTFAVPKFGSPGRYEAELLSGNVLVGTIDVNV